VPPHLIQAESRRLGKVALFGGWLSFRPPLFRFASKPCPLDGCPMFALSRTWVEDDLFPMLSPQVFTYLQEKKMEGLRPDFLWSLVALAHLMRLSLLKAAHAAVGVSATWQEIRVAHLVQPMYAKAEHGAPVQGARLGEEARDLLRKQRITLTPSTFWREEQLNTTRSCQMLGAGSSIAAHVASRATPGPPSSTR
jgi:hypothetical protein